MTTHRKDETLSPAEARDVFELAARLEGAAEPRVEDVAETLNLGVADVWALVAEVRARPQTPAKARRSLAAYAGWAVALLAVAWSALRPAPFVSPLPASPPAFAPVPEGMASAPLQQVAVVPLDLVPPEGYDVGVKANGVVLSLAGRRDVRPKGNADPARRLADAIALLTQRAEEIGSSRVFSGGRIALPDDMGKMEVWVNGPGSGTSFDLPAETHTGPSSITTLKARRAVIEATVAGMFAKRSMSVGPETGIVGQYFPPAGFQVAFKGRRQAGMNSAPLPVEPFDEAAATRRLFLALRAMMDADLKPVEGRWRQDAALERLLKTPDRSRFTLDTLDGHLEFDVPTKPGTPRTEQDRVLQAKAEEAIRDYVRRGRASR